MSFDVSTSAVVGVLNEVNGVYTTYEKLVTGFGEAVSALATATKAEPIGTALQGASEKAFSPDITNVVGRTGTALSAVNQVVTILTDADSTMSQTAREQAASAQQAKADDAPGATTGSGHTPRNAR
ncbi:hypothetical protein GCM10011512_25140 [Tersicoccus solisilvae]|uniref:ESX-1 secretion-associated protein n=1 Tax=Tersicoccus solisilvae TaxID=1882339 RepID=A0ABQ1PH10_9MICC|nr:DUF6507 family protein [Tersicoccus solisilvae]GGC97107.1 hypothetical protein GCM10011512_25140 [Tersicoccus solisilvae]